MRGEAGRGRVQVGGGSYVYVLTLGGEEEEEMLGGWVGGGTGGGWLRAETS